VADVSELLSLPQPNLSQHLSILKREGIVDYTVDGKKLCYFLTEPELIRTLLAALKHSLG